MVFLVETDTSYKTMRQVLWTSCSVVFLSGISVRPIRLYNGRGGGGWQTDPCEEIDLSTEF